MIEIKTKYTDYAPKQGQYKNALVLGHSDWNDYGYRTFYEMYYCDEEGTAHDVGGLKIYNKNLDKKNTANKSELDISSFIPYDKPIKELSFDYCSLGQNLDYYYKLKQFFPNEYKSILYRLRDMSINETIKVDFIDYFGVKDSLLRDSGAEKALNEAVEILSGKQLKHDMSFVYRYNPPFSDLSTNIEVNFDDSNLLFPYRITAVVGKNGTGKTNLLNSLARAISGDIAAFKDRRDAFLGRRPPFYKVMSISYSAFDGFSKPKDNKFCNYIYCGIQNEMSDSNGKKYCVPMTKSELKRKCKSTLEEIEKSRRYDSWREIINELIGENELDSLESQLGVDDEEELTLSSGQNMLIHSITMVIAYIENESILLIDEPEMHLHPNAISSLMRMLNRLLNKYNSYALIATHSPLVLQELPSHNILILDRSLDNVLTTRRPSIECFGAGVSNIIDDIFDVRNNESSFKSILQEAATKMSEEEILNYFNRDLSMNAMIYLKTLYEGIK